MSESLSTIIPPLHYLDQVYAGPTFMQRQFKQWPDWLFKWTLLLINCPVSLILAIPCLLSAGLGACLKPWNDQHCITRWAKTLFIALMSLPAAVAIIAAAPIVLTTMLSVFILIEFALAACDASRYLADSSYSPVASTC